jgi:hypothetical protein
LTKTIEYSAALCAAGKTEYACNLIASEPGKYLLAVDRREVIETRINRINEKAAAYGTYPVFRRIYSPDEDRFEDGVIGVRRALREQPTKDSETPHVVVICTHEALISSDLSTYEGWTLIIDESPNLWGFGEMSCPISWVVMESFFGLEPLDDGWSKLTIKREAPSPTASEQDSLLSNEFVEVYRRWESNRPVVKLESWQDAADGRTFSWHSVWDANKLTPFSRVLILANCFEDSITYKLLKNAGCKLVPFAIRDTQTWLPRTIRIRYFAQDHRAGTGFWTNKNDPNGALALVKAGTWTWDNTDPANHFWSCNLKSKLNLPGQKIQPKVSGMDDYKRFSCASFFYTAKPSKAEEVAFARYGISREEVIRAREFEDLVQFLGRTCWRIPDDSREIDFRVYDYWQALFLEEFIANSGRPFTVILEHVEEAGVDEHKPQPVGRPKAVLTEAEKAERAVQRQKANTASKQRARAAQEEREREQGIVRRKPGRPTKDRSARGSSSVTSTQVSPPPG